MEKERKERRKVGVYERRGEDCKEKWKIGTRAGKKTARYQGRKVHRGDKENRKR